MSTRKFKLSEEALISALAERHENGARALYDMYAAALYGVICRIIPNTHLAEDILQESLLKIWHNFSLYDPAKGRLFTWMINLTRNLAFDTLRSKRYRQSLLHEELEKADDCLSPTEAAFCCVDRKMIRDGLDVLPPKEKLVIELIYFKGYKHTEVADELQMPLGSVKTSYRAAIARLRTIYLPAAHLGLAS